MRLLTLVISLLISSLHVRSLEAEDAALVEEAKAAMKQAATLYREQVATHGGYVYLYTLDLDERWGEGEATKDQIWVQPPGTPTVGMAYLEAYEATGDRYYLDAATDAALALVYGQLKSGGWTNKIDFDPDSPHAAAYRNGKGRGKNNSSLDDGQTQSALRLVMRVDRALSFQNPTIHESASIALDALLAAQFANGGFPQVWTGPVEAQPIVKASYPEYDWRTQGRIKNYWDMVTLNDNNCDYVADALIEAHAIYGRDDCLQALRKLGDFFILAQMPEPQPAWAQQYNYQMHPIWARKFEPPAIAGHESQGVIQTLMKIYEATGDRKYLEPIPRALEYLEGSRLPDGRLARYCELETNKPLYMFRRGDVYTLTYDDSDLPAHYSWKTASRVDRLQRRYADLTSGVARKEEATISADRVRQIIRSLDERGRWVNTHDGDRLMGQTKLPPLAKYIASNVFSHNLSALAEFVGGASHETACDNIGAQAP